MKSVHAGKAQTGVALVVALLFLLVVTIISVIAASNSTLGLKMASNMQDAYASFQAAEAGAIATLGLAGTANNPFDVNGDTLTPFAAFDPNSNHPLRDVFGGAGAVDVDVFLTNTRLACPRSAAGSSVGLLECDYYRVASEHAVAQRARTRVQLGVVKTTIGSSGQ
ncbi:MAG: hypothetical protein KDI16_12805 [Halioglobus sp.]|nr:hypothetical protein [Halioglobus sp.]